MTSPRQVDIPELGTWSPYQITSKNDSRGQNAASRHVNSQASLLPYKLSAQVQMATSQQVSQPWLTYSSGYRSQVSQHHQLRSFNAPGNITVPRYYSCPSGCQCDCHALPQRACSHDKKYKRPCVIMAPVKSEKPASSTVTHLPLQVRALLSQGLGGAFDLCLAKKP